MLTMLGIPNCDTVKKARNLLEANQVAYTFRDIRKEPLTADEWRGLIGQDQEKRLINTRGPSFRKTGRKSSELDADVSLEVLLAQPTAMKRPAMVNDGKLVNVGFQADDFLTVLEEK